MILNLLLASAEHIDPLTVQTVAEVANETHEIAHQMGFMEYIFHSNVINFLLVAWFLIHVIKKSKVLDAIPNERKLIIDKIEHSENIKKEVKDEYDNTQEKLQNVDIEAKEIVKNGKEVTVSLVNQIEIETEQEQRALNEKTLKLLEAEKLQAANEITQEVSKAAVYIAKEHIQKSINEEMHHKFINNFIDNLGNIDSEKVKK